MGEGKDAEWQRDRKGHWGNTWTVRTEWMEAEDKLDSGTDSWLLSLFIFPLAAGLMGWGTMPH